MKTATDIPDISLARITGAADIGALPSSRANAAERQTKPDALASPSLLRDFYELTKPRLNFMVVITTFVGFYMASKTTLRHIDFGLLAGTIFGTTLTAAAAGVLNQYVERDLDRSMTRTANRPLPAGRIAPFHALLMGILLGVGGILYLNFMVNPLTALLGAATLGSYVFVYTPLKRQSTLCTIVGAVPGAIPPVMGFTGLQDQISAEAIALFTILFFWQMPHFLAIAIMYKDDYAAGGFKMLPVIDPDLSMTSRQIIIYTLSLLLATLFPYRLGMAGIGYVVVALLGGLIFLWHGVVASRLRDRSSARKLFFCSIIYLPVVLTALMLDKV